MPSEGLAPEVGTKFCFRTKPQPGWDGIVDCEALAVDEPRQMLWVRLEEDAGAWALVACGH